ncbi:MAG: hypothetical protein ACOCQD_02610 [archaeon]
MFNKEGFNKLNFNKATSIHIVINYNTLNEIGLVSNMNYNTLNDIGFINNNLYNTLNSIGLIISINYDTLNDIGVLNKILNYNTLNKIGYITNIIVSTSNKVGLIKSKKYSTFSQIMFLNEKPIFIESNYGKAIRLGKSDLDLNIQLNKYTIRMKRRAVDSLNYNEVVLRNDGAIYVNGELNNNYNIDWFDDSDNIIIKHDAWEIDELLVIPKIIPEEEIQKWYNNELYFYDHQNIHSLDIPSDLNMQLL